MNYPPLPKDVIEFLKEKAPKDLLDTDLTKYRAAETWGVTIDRARKRLDVMVKRGELEVVKKYDPERRNNVNVYAIKGR